MKQLKQLAFELFCFFSMVGLSFGQPSLGQILPDGTPALGSERPISKGPLYSPTLEPIKKPVEVRSKLNIDDDSISKALQLADYLKDGSDGRFVLRLSLSSKLSLTEREGIGSSEGPKAVEHFREQYYPEQFGNRAIYDPDFSRRDGEVVSIAVRPADVPKTLARIGKDFPQVKKVWAEYQQYELQDMSKLADYPVMKSVRFPRDYDYAGLAKQGIEPLMKMPSGECQLIVRSKAQDQWLSRAVKSFAEQKVFYPEANAIESPSSLTDHSSNQKSEHYIWRRGHSRSELADHLREESIRVKEFKPTRIFFDATDEQVAQLKKKGLRVYKTPESKT